MNIYDRKRSLLILLVVTLVIAAAATACSPLFKAEQFDRIIGQKGYEVTEQSTASLTLSIPKSALSEQIFAEGGETFESHQVIAYQDETTTIYLAHVQYANAGNDQMYFTFDFVYDLPKDHGGCLLPYEVTGPNRVSTGSFSLQSKSLRDDVTVHENAVLVGGQGPGESICFYVSTDALAQAEGTLCIDIFLNKLTYSKP